MVSNLPWEYNTKPLMLAPMQGLTNRAMRAYFIDTVRPDVVFTEFMQIRSQNQKVLMPSDRKEAVSAYGGVPMVAQLIGHDPEALAAAAMMLEGNGVAHLNLNLGCPYGRRSSGLTGGAMLSRPEHLLEVVQRLRDAIRGSFSVKLRAGYDDPEQIFSLLPMFEAAGVDFLVLHPRTVVQKYDGRADHALTARVVRSTRLPVIANGDLIDAATGVAVLAESGAAGLMLGRGAIGDPLLFERLRGRATADPAAALRRRELGGYLLEIVHRYRSLFCGDHQVLVKTKEVLNFVWHPALAEIVRDLKRSRSLDQFLDLAEGLGGTAPAGVGRH